MTKRLRTSACWLLFLTSLTALFVWVRADLGGVLRLAELAPAAGIIALLSLLPLPAGDSLVTLTHLISLYLLLTLGPAEAGFSLTTGMLAAWVIERLLTLRFSLSPDEYLLTSSKWGFTFSRQVFSLIGSAALYQALGGFVLADRVDVPSLIPIIALSLSFSALYLLSHWIEHLCYQYQLPERRSFVLLVVASLLPAPFAILGATAYLIMGPYSIVFIGMTTIILAAGIRSLILAEKNLQRRIQELSTINHISAMMRTSLDLEELLEGIYQQVAQLLHIENFYIALHDENTHSLSYPIARKGGERQHWPRRPVADRLTDRVIQHAESILIPSDGSRSIKNMGLLELENAPEAWLGVPLLQPDRALGCLSIFHTQRGKILTEKDKILLETIAGQAAAAIENALLYEQTHSRAQALSSLNRITTSMSSTLDPERTLEMVCQSVIQVCGGNQSAIYLLDQEHGQLKLAHASNLSPAFLSSWAAESRERNVRNAAFHDKAIILVPDLQNSRLPAQQLALLRKEGIQSYADLPLMTHEGTIGMLSVYFASSQRFTQPEVDLLETFAAQAALSVANARAHAETDDALRKRVEQLASLEAIGREMTATLKQEELFSVILDHALQISHAERGHLAIYLEDERALRVSAQKGYASLAALPGQYNPNDELAGKAFRTGLPVMFSGPQLSMLHSAWLQPDTQAVLCIPLFSRDKRLGVLVVENHPSGAFSEEDERFLSQLAAQATVAISNANLYQQLEARLREQSLLYQASAQIAASLDMEAVTLAAVDSLAVALDVDGVILSRWNPDTSRLMAQASVIDGKPAFPDNPEPIPYDTYPALLRALNERKPLQWTITTAAHEADRTYLQDVRQCESILIVPLVAGEHTLGLLEAFSYRERSFDENVLRSAQTIASQTAVGMENTNLFQRVSESNDRILAVLNSTNEGILMFNIEGKVLLANPRITDLLLLEEEQLLAMNITESDCPLADLLGYRRADFVNLLTYLQRGKVVQGEQYAFENESRSLMRIDSPVQDTSGQVIGWLVVLRDISEERKLEAAREHLTEMIVHDLRSPLTAILGSLTLLDRVMDEQKETVVEQALSVSRRSVEQMLGLVNSLLDIAKLESGDLPLERTRFKVTKLLKEIIEVYVQEANQVGVILNHHVPATFPYMTADREKIQRVIVNLLDNALKFTPTGGEIQLTLNQDEEAMLLTVSDTGPGIPEEYRERIFERFSQIPGAISRRRGTGLGLAFAKIAVTAHGGTIWINEPPEGGSAFHIRIPLQPAS